MIQIKLTEEEILQNPNDSELGAVVRKKFYTEKHKLTDLNTELLNEKNIKKVLNKLRQPCHINFISNLLKIELLQAKLFIDYLIDHDMVKETPQHSGYYTTNKKI